jgi:hypothetical protein
MASCIYFNVQYNPLIKQTSWFVEVPGACHFCIPGFISQSDPFLMWQDWGLIQGSYVNHKNNFQEYFNAIFQDINIIVQFFWLPMLLSGKIGYEKKKTECNLLKLAHSLACKVSRYHLRPGCPSHCHFSGLILLCLILWIP